jgi:hypothetical protein
MLPSFERANHAKLAQELAVRVELLNALIARVGYQNVAIFVDDDGARAIENARLPIGHASCVD